MNTLQDIITYVRRIVKTPSDQALSNAVIVDYLNRFYTYDVPARLQLFELKTKYNLETIPNVDQYNMPVNADGNLLYQNLLSPAYVDGMQVGITTSRDQFQKGFPNYVNNLDVAVGDGGATYSFTVAQTPFIRGHVDLLGNLDPGVYVSTLDTSGNQMLLVDTPPSSPGGYPSGSPLGTLGPLVGPVPSPIGGTGTVNYETGLITVVFTNPVALGTPIQVQTVLFAEGKPRLILFYNNVIRIRPPPDRTYLIEFDAYLTPSTFLATDTAAALTFGYMSEYLARGTARKILSDVGDMDQIQFYEPFFREQEMLVVRRTDRQRCIDRTPTIFSSTQNQSPWLGVGNQG